MFDPIKNYEDACKGRLNWDNARTDLRARFTTGEIIKSTRNELEWYLVVLANSSDSQCRTIENTEAERFATVIRHLLQARIAEDLHEKSHNLSIWALVVAIAAAIFTGVDALHKIQEPHATMLPSVSAISSLQSSPEKTVLPESKTTTLNDLNSQPTASKPAISTNH
jgi:hypothetical protein